MAPACPAVTALNVALPPALRAPGGDAAALPPPAWTRVAPRRASGAGAFLIEAAGGTVGSATGFGLGVLIADVGGCGSDDIGCWLSRLGIALGISGATSAVGALLTGHMGDTQPSTAGAIVGGIAGIPAGVGVVHLISEELDLTRDDAVTWVSYVFTQGIVTALGSRIGAALRN
jgi:hypothetical protein